MAKWRLRAVTLLALVASFLVVLGGTTSCQEEVEDNAVEVAFQNLVAAVRAEDSAALYRFTTDRVRAFLEELHRDLADAERLLRQYFPEWQQKALAERLALHRFGGVASAEDLFGRLVEFDKIREGEAVVAGLEHEPPLIEGDRATLRTAAGEVFLFVLENGEWRTTAYDSVTSLPVIETLRGNVAILRENVRRLKELYKTADDPHAPEGAFNELRGGLVEKDGRIVLTLLDEPGRKAIGKAREALAALQKLDERERKAKLAAVELPDLDLATATATDRKLAMALVKAGRLQALLGIDESSAIHLVRLVSRSEAVIVTTEADEFAFLLEKDGLWHIADTGPLIRDALTAPLAPQKAETAP